MTFLACAALLASAVVITGCKNDNEPQAKAPKVTTDIAISPRGNVSIGSLMAIRI